MFFQNIFIEQTHFKLSCSPVTIIFCGACDNIVFLFQSSKKRHTSQTQQEIPIKRRRPMQPTTDGSHSSLVHSTLDCSTSVEPPKPDRNRSRALKRSASLMVEVTVPTENQQRPEYGPPRDPPKQIENNSEMPAVLVRTHFSYLHLIHSFAHISNYQSFHWANILLVVICHKYRQRLQCFGTFFKQK
jgi:hypothetical protein